MPYSRPTLTQLIAQGAANFAARLAGADATLRRAVVGVVNFVVSGLVNGLYGYLDWIAKMAVPWTAQNEFLTGWANLKGVYQKPAVAASNGQVTFTFTAAATVSSGAQLKRGDGVLYTTSAAATLGGAGTLAVGATAVVAGVNGNCLVNAVLTLTTAVAGVNSQASVSTAFTNGLDQETQPAFQARMLQAYQEPPEGGALSDYVQWALQVEGVTRAWAVPNGNGIGTVVVYPLLDVTEAAYGGIPQGTNGVAAAEPRGAAATGDQLTVANYIFPLQPVCALVYVWAAQPNIVNFTIQGLAGASSTVKSAIAAAITSVFQTVTEGASTVSLDAAIAPAVAAAAQTEVFDLTSPTADIVSAANAVPVLGTITWI